MLEGSVPETDCSGDDAEGKIPVCPSELGAATPVLEAVDPIDGLEASESDLRVDASSELAAPALLSDRQSAAHSRSLQKGCKTICRPIHLVFNMSCEVYIADMDSRSPSRKRISEQHSKVQRLLLSSPGSFV